MRHLKRARHAGHNGYSLLELMIVLVIGAITCGAAGSRLRSMLLAAQLRSEAALLQSSIEDLSLVAQFRQQTVSLFVANNLYRATLGGTSGEVKLKHAFPAGIAAMKATTLSLYPTGVVSPETIEIRSQFESCSVTAALRGRVDLACG